MEHLRICVYLNLYISNIPYHLQRADKRIHASLPSVAMLRKPSAELVGSENNMISLVQLLFFFNPARAHEADCIKCWGLSSAKRTEIRRNKLAIDCFRLSRYEVYVGNVCWRRGARMCPRHFFNLFVSWFNGKASTSLLHTKENPSNLMWAFGKNINMRIFRHMTHSIPQRCTNKLGTA